MQVQKVLKSTNIALAGNVSGLNEVIFNDLKTRT